MPRSRRYPTLTIPIRPDLLARVSTIWSEGGPDAPTLVSQAVERWLTDYEQRHAAQSDETPPIMNEPR